MYVCMYAGEASTVCDGHGGEQFVADGDGVEFDGIFVSIDLRSKIELGNVFEKRNRSLRQHV